MIFYHTYFRDERIGFSLYIRVYIYISFILDVYVRTMCFLESANSDKQAVRNVSPAKLCDYKLFRRF